MIYRALYGEPTLVDPPDGPALNEFRKLPKRYTYLQAEAMCKPLWDLAAFDRGTEGMLLRRLDTLRSILRKERTSA